MGTVTVSSSASSAQLALSRTFSSFQSPSRSSQSFACKSIKTKNNALVAPSEPASISTDSSNDTHERLRSPDIKRPHSLDGSSVCILELDYNEAAAKLESIYKHGLRIDTYEVEDRNCTMRRKRQPMKNIKSVGQGCVRKVSKKPVRNWWKKPKRLSLDKRIAMRMSREDGAFFSILKRNKMQDKGERINNLLQEYTGSNDFISFDWKKLRIPAVLQSSEQAWLFKMMQPMKALLQVKEKLQQELGREPMDSDLAMATNTNQVQVRKDLEIGRAARKKLIKHNLRLVLFVVHKYFPEFASGPKFQDLCQAGVKGLITAIDRFEPKRNLQLSTLGFFWIRHAVREYVTLSSFMRVSFGLELVRLEIQKAKLQLSFELQRLPDEEEIIQRVGISAKRYYEVMRVSEPILSLHFRHPKTREESINGITVTDDVGRAKWQQPAFLRLALDDMLESLKPDERLVIRQRYGLDGKGERTLGEIAENLNISRELVREHEVKALRKLKHPARADGLRGYIC